MPVFCVPYAGCRRWLNIQKLIVNSAARRYSSAETEADVNTSDLSGHFHLKLKGEYYGHHKRSKGLFELSKEAFRFNFGTKGFAILPDHILRGVTDLVHYTELGNRPGEYALEGFGKSLQVIGAGNQNIFHAPSF